jgi:small nuclear ribonucleoprotein (snRNP)-like protein
MHSATSREKVESLLGERIKCTLDDGRSVTGTFLCVDRLTNIILTNATEERMVYSTDYSDTKDEKIIATRSLSQVMIPGERLEMLEVDQVVFTSRIQSVPDSAS